MNLKLWFGKVKTRRNRSKISLTSSRHNLRRLVRRSKIEKVTNRRICDAYTDLLLIYNKRLHNYYFIHTKVFETQFIHKKFYNFKVIRKNRDVIYTNRKF